MLTDLDEVVYFDYPLEQGLRPNAPEHPTSIPTYFDYPLEQGLRLAFKPLAACAYAVF